MSATILNDRPGEVVIEAIEGDGGRLSLTAADNCAGIAAIETLKLLGKLSCGVSLKLHKVFMFFSMQWQWSESLHKTAATSLH